MILTAVFSVVFTIVVIATVLWFGVPYAYRKIVARMLHG